MKIRVRGQIANLALGALLGLLLLPLPSAAPAEKAVAAEAPPSSGLGSVWLYELNVTSNSDWTRVELTGGPAVLGVYATLVRGANASGLSYAAQPAWVSISKRPTDTTLVMVTMELLATEGTTIGNVTVTKGDLGSTNATLGFYESGRFPSFMDFADSGTGGSSNRSATIDYSTLYANPSDSSSLQPIPSSLDHKVFAFYYPWWGNPAGPSGKWSHWVGVGANKSLILRTTDYPLFGTYDSQDQNIIGAQILMARQAGIDGFISSWWGARSFTDQSFSVLLHVAQEMNFTTTIYYETVRTLTPSDMVKELSYVVQEYGSNPAFLKADGRPVIFVYAVATLGRNATFWQEVRTGLESEVGPVYLIGDLNDRSFVNVFDGFHNYLQLNYTQMTRNYDFFASNMSTGLPFTPWSNLLGYVDHQTPLPVEKKAIFFSVIPGDDRLGANRTGDGPINLVERQNGETYAEFWKAAISANASSVLIASWNEWHEGTELEPSEQYGFGYLQLTRMWVDQYEHQSATQAGLPEIRVAVSPPAASQYQGESDVNVSLTNVGGSAALLTNVTLAWGQGLNPASFADQGFQAYYEKPGSESYGVTIPLILPGETVSVGVSYRLFGNGTLAVATQSFNPEGDSTGRVTTHWDLTGASATTTARTISSTTSAVTSSTTSARTVPEFPYQLAASTVVVIVVVASYLVIRRRPEEGLDSLQ